MLAVLTAPAFHFAWVCVAGLFGVQRCHPCSQLSVEGTPVVGEGLRADVSGASAPLVLTADFLTLGAVRVRLTEKDMAPRWQVGRVEALLFFFGLQPSCTPQYPCVSPHRQHHPPPLPLPLSPPRLVFHLSNPHWRRCGVAWG